MPPSRRQFFRRAVGLCALGAASVLAVVRVSGYHVDPARARSLRALSPWQLVVVDAVLLRMCGADVPYDAPGAPPSPAEVGAAEFVDAFIAESPPHIRSDLLQLIALVEHGYPLSCGYRRRFTALDHNSQDDVLARLERSSVDLLRGCFSALKSLMMMAYYRDPRTWGIIDYDGPLVNRPDKGWTPPRFVALGTKGATPP